MTTSADERAVTAAEYQTMPDPRNGRLTLTRGRLGVEPWPSLSHGFLHARLCGLLRDAVGRRPHRVVGRIGIIAGRDPDTVRGLDISVWSPERISQRCPVTGWPLVGPDFGFAIVSPSDTSAGMSAVFNDLLAVGTGTLFVLNPLSGTIAVHITGRHPLLLRGDERVPIPAPLTGWTPTVAELLAEED